MYLDFVPPHNPAKYCGGVPAPSGVPDEHAATATVSPASVAEATEIQTRRIGLLRLKGWCGALSVLVIYAS